MQSKAAELILENGMRFKGKAFGYVKDEVGEVVFSTSMTGYQEAITDLSFCGQMVVLTYPLIGNYGINLEDMESDKPALTALIVREKCDYPNNFRTEMDLDGFLRQNRIVGLEGIDTRALTRVIRESGCMKGIITTEIGMLSDRALKERFDSLDNSDVVKRVSTPEVYTIPGAGKHVAFIDAGVKKGILRELKLRGCKITVFPYNAKPEEIRAVSPDLLMISNGPGDPEDIPETVEIAKAFIGSLPVRGVCMGHLVIGLAMGCKTQKLKFGHHGANQPVKNLKTGKVSITSQNHNYILDNLPDELEVSYINVNDGTCEGICGKTVDVKSVQFHPEASPGPLDTRNIFDDFLA